MQAGFSVSAEYGIDPHSALAHELRDPVRPSGADDPVDDGEQVDYEDLVHQPVAALAPQRDRQEPGD